MVVVGGLYPVWLVCMSFDRDYVGGRIHLGLEMEWVAIEMVLSARIVLILVITRKTYDRGEGSNSIRARIAQTEIIE